MTISITNWDGGTVDNWQPIFTNKNVTYFKKLDDKKFPCYFSPQFFDELNKAVKYDRTTTCH